MKNKNRLGVIYSTNSNYEYIESNNEEITLSPSSQELKVHIDKHRAGKVAVIIKNFIGTNEDLKTLGKILKTKCGVGGTCKKGEIIIQGDVRDKIMNILNDQGYKYKRVGG